MATYDPEYEDDESNVRTERSFRQAQGIFEAEICCGEELDIHTCMELCPKNPGHKGFVPVNEFTVAHLPADYQDDVIVQLIKAMADITVHLSVEHTSSQRPDFYPGTKKPYPFAEHKGTKKVRKGSGWVFRVTIHVRGRNKKSGCPCQKCKGQPWSWQHQQWAFIDIYTATHLVYDEKEAVKTKCSFFYDTNDTSINDVPSLHGAIRVHNDVDGDACTVTYLTHDISLAQKLQSKWELYESLHKQVGEKYNTNMNDGQTVGESPHKLTVIASHPHGCSKQISVGQFVKREEMEYNDVYTKYTYTTPTCPGCSGAPVYILSRWWWWGCDHPHGGHCEDNLNLNYSGIAMY